jgi:hypothetical protein
MVHKRTQLGLGDGGGAVAADDLGDGAGQRWRCDGDHHRVGERGVDGQRLGGGGVRGRGLDGEQLPGQQLRGATEPQPGPRLVLRVHGGYGRDLHD